MINAENRRLWEHRLHDRRASGFHARGHQAVLDAVVDHLDEVAALIRHAAILAPIRPRPIISR